MQVIWVSVGCVTRVRCTDARTLRTPVPQRTARTDTDCMPVLYTLQFLKHRAVLKELFIHRIHRIHRRQHAFTDDTGMSKHRLSPYNAYYHN